MGLVVVGVLANLLVCLPMEQERIFEALCLQGLQQLGTSEGSGLSHPPIKCISNSGICYLIELCFSSC